MDASMRSRRRRGDGPMGGGNEASRRFAGKRTLTAQLGAPTQAAPFAPGGSAGPGVATTAAGTSDGGGAIEAMSLHLPRPSAYAVTGAACVELDGAGWTDVTLTVVSAELVSWLAAAPLHTVLLAGFVPVYLAGVDVAQQRVQVLSPADPSRLGGLLALAPSGLDPSAWQGGASGSGGATSDVTTADAGATGDTAASGSPARSADTEPVDGPIEQDKDVVAAVNFHRKHQPPFRFEWVEALQAHLGCAATGSFDRATVQRVAALQGPDVDDDELGRVTGGTLGALRAALGVEPVFATVSAEFEQRLSADGDWDEEIAAMKDEVGDSDNHDWDDLEEHARSVEGGTKKAKKADKRARASGVPAWESGGVAAIVRECRGATFAGRVYVAHPMLIERLALAEEKLEAETGKRGEALGDELGIAGLAALRDGFSYHGLGWAVDVDASDNPYMGGESFDPADGSLRNRFRYRSNVEVLITQWHAAWFCGRGEVLSGPVLAAMRDGQTTDQIYARIADTSEAFATYLAIRDGSGALALPDPGATPPSMPDVTELHGKIRKADTIDPGIQQVIDELQARVDAHRSALGAYTAARWRELAADDHRRMTSLGDGELEALRDEMGKDGSAAKLVNANFLTTGRDPDAGFMTLDDRLVRALRDVGGLCWGATDFAGENELGDIQHFDIRTDPRAHAIVEG
jgi:hypothetical protein